MTLAQPYLSFILVASLIGAAAMDIRNRTIPNAWWKWTAIIAAPGILYELVTDPTSTGIRVGIAAAWSIACILLWMGRVMGGADAKGLMIMGLLASPVDYYDPSQVKFLLAFDAFPSALLIGEGWRRWRKATGYPYFVPLLPVTLFTMYRGGLLWQPLLWIRDLLT